MSECASRMANHHVATVPESLERAPIKVRAPHGERGVSAGTSFPTGNPAGEERAEEGEALDKCELAVHTSRLPPL